MKRKAVIVGAGFTGLTAGVLLSEKGWKVDIFETRGHLGGICWDEKRDQVFVHLHGPHVFHTQNEETWDFVNRFSFFWNYRHKELARVSGKLKLPLLPFPYTAKTEEILGRPWSPKEIQDCLFNDYVQKFWGKRYEALPANILGRLPVFRDRKTEEMFLDPFQGMPREGYCGLFKNMAAEINGNIHFKVSEEDWRSMNSHYVIYTGGVDQYFKFAHGPLPYRGMFISHQQALRKDVQAAVVNECNKDFPYIRTTDYSRFMEAYFFPEDAVPISREYISVRQKLSDIPYFPINWDEGLDLYKKYLDMTTEENVIFCGRLGSFKHLNMDQAICEGFKAAEAVLKMAES